MCSADDQYIAADHSVHPNDTVVVAMESGNNASGRAGSLPSPDYGLLRSPMHRAPQNRVDLPHCVMRITSAV
ncbi:MAG: hypothetical protein ACLTJG_13640 [[Clostridium] innocuum]